MILTLTTPFVFKSAIVGHYLLNQNYYATELCENKDNVQKNCNGLCQLNQELSSDTKSENQTPQELPNTELSSFIIPSFFPEKALFFSFLSEFNAHYLFDEPADLVDKLKKPPRFLC